MPSRTAWCPVRHDCHGLGCHWLGNSIGVVYNALSRVPTLDENVTPAMPETRCVKVKDPWTECLWAMPRFDEPKSHDECLWAMPKFNEQNCHPFRFETIEYYQQHSANVCNLAVQVPHVFANVPFGASTIVCKVQNPDECLIVLPDAMLPWLVRWYHEMTVHAEGVD